MTSILIVEDDNDINNLICDTLKAEGYQCERAFDGKEGADKIEQNRYDPNMEALRKQDTVKFVSGSINDLECAEKIIEKFHLTERCQVFISSVFGSIEPVEIVNFMTSKRMNDVRLQIQMHKVIWNPEERGV